MEEDKESLIEKGEHQLYSKFTFYFRPNKSDQSWEASCQKICSFNTGESFWGYYQHFTRPSQLPKGSSFFLFRQGVKPMFEDPANKKGGRFFLDIKREFADQIWEDLILTFIGISPPHQLFIPKGEKCQESSIINGLCLKVRGWGATLSIWVKKCPQKELDTTKIWVRKGLGFKKNAQAGEPHFLWNKQQNIW